MAKWISVEQMTHRNYCALLRSSDSTYGVVWMWRLAGACRINSSEFDAKERQRN